MPPIWVAQPLYIRQKFSIDFHCVRLLEIRLKQFRKFLLRRRRKWLGKKISSLITKFSRRRPLRKIKTTYAKLAEIYRSLTAVSFEFLLFKPPFIQFTNSELLYANFPLHCHLALVFWLRSKLSSFAAFAFPARYRRSFAISFNPKSFSPLHTFGGETRKVLFGHQKRQKV